jgi:hypothetical protein
MQVRHAPFGSTKDESSESREREAPKTSGCSDFARVQVVGVGTDPADNRNDE